MAAERDILQRVRDSARVRVLFLPHAVRQMSRPERMIGPEEVMNVLMHGAVIEDYPEDARGHSCLILGRGVGGRPLHVVCSPKEDFVAIITAYIPDPREWDDRFSARRTP
jgi:hypothetical protein